MRHIMAALRADCSIHGARMMSDALFVVRAVWSRHCAVILNSADSTLDSYTGLGAITRSDVSHDAVDAPRAGESLPMLLIADPSLLNLGRTLTGHNFVCRDIPWSAE
jgi:hypothetical protein